jgi:hypothetical protein
MPRRDENDRRVSSSLYEAEGKCKAYIPSLVGRNVPLPPLNCRNEMSSRRAKRGRSIDGNSRDVWLPTGPGGEN